jgi:UDP-N-acetylglucosamine/UDP-N-acetylgalactosamine diphosphorylase
MHSALLNHLRRFGQEHVLAYWNQLSPTQQHDLERQIRSLDLAALAALHRAAPHQNQDWAELARRAAPPRAFREGSDNRAAGSPDANSIPREEAIAAGSAALAAGRVGVILVAGGQGTRLGFPHPKGMYPIGPVSRHSLFQILIEKLIAVRRRSAAPIPLYVMTSPATHDETAEFLAVQRRFGMPHEDVKLFRQGTMPAIDAATGKLLLEDKASLFLAPDGHGGMLIALSSHGLLEEMTRRGLHLLCYVQVDNPLVELCDPAFIGYHVLSRSEMSTQVVAKSSPRENVGNVVQIDGRTTILEYSDLNPLSDEIVLRTTPEGQPVFWAGNTAVHVFDLDFLRRMALTGDALPFHVARKPAPYLDEQGNKVQPRDCNALKFERFIFDLLPAARQAIVVEVDRRRAFAPLKNGIDRPSDNPDTVQEQMISLHTQWLRAAGVDVVPGMPVEISPLYADTLAALRERTDLPRTINAPTFLTGA